MEQRLGLLLSSGEFEGEPVRVSLPPPPFPKRPHMWKSLPPNRRQALSLYTGKGPAVSKSSVLNLHAGDLLPAYGDGDAHGALLSHADYSKGAAIVGGEGAGVVLLFY